MRSPRSEPSEPVRAVVDTNIWVSGLIRPLGPPGRVLSAVRSRRIVAVTSWALAEEIVEVLRRPKLARYGISAGDIEEVVGLLGPLLPRIDVTTPLRDLDDLRVVEETVAGGADAVITGDADLLDDAAVMRWLADRDVEVLTAAEALVRLAAS